MSATVTKGKQGSRQQRGDAKPAAPASNTRDQGKRGSSQPQASAVETNRLADVNVQDTLTTTIGSSIHVRSLIFDVDWYRIEYPDVAAANLDPVRHYFDNGFREGRNPNRDFDTNWYASSNPDVAAAGLNPFLHYLLYGAREGRKPAP